MTFLPQPCTVYIYVRHQVDLYVLSITLFKAVSAGRGTDLINMDLRLNRLTS